MRLFKRKKILLSNEDGIFKIGDGNIEKCVKFMEKIHLVSNGRYMKPGDWLIQEVEE